jgi:hypothetical protein
VTFVVVVALHGTVTLPRVLTNPLALIP